MPFALLYNLKTDPVESDNLSERYPNLVIEMDRQLQEWAEQIESDRNHPLH